MVNREETLTALRRHKEAKFDSCDNCPYVSYDSCSRTLFSDILNLLEPVNVEQRVETSEWNCCSNCGNHVISKWKFCPYCRRELKWN